MNFSAAWQSRLPTRSHVYSTPATWRVWRSAGSFQLLCHSEQPGDGIPVSCSTGVLQGPIQQWRKFRASYAVGKIDVEFAAGYPQFLGIGFDSEKRFPSARGGICGEEGDEKFAWVEVAMRERIFLYYISQKEVRRITPGRKLKRRSISFSICRASRARSRSLVLKMTLPLWTYVCGSCSPRDS